MTYSCTVTDPEDLDKIISIRRWARQHCASYVTMTVHLINEAWYFSFWFSEPQDQTLFTLAWS
jgi:hypothetical protein